MRIGWLKIRTRPLSLIWYQPFGWIRAPWGWSIGICCIAVSWINVQTIEEELAKALEGLDDETHDTTA